MKRLLLALLLLASPVAGQVDVVFPGYRVYVADSDSTISTHQTYHVALERAVNWAVSNNRATRIGLLGPVRVSVEPWAEVSDTVYVERLDTVVVERVDTVYVGNDEPDDNPDPIPDDDDDPPPVDDDNNPPDEPADTVVVPPTDTAIVVIPPPAGEGVWLEQVWNYSSTSAMRADPNIEGAGDAGGRGESRPVVLSQPGPWGGNQALENYFGITPDTWQPQVATNWYFPRTERELWIETWIRFGDTWSIGPGNSTYAAYNGNVDHKTIFIWEEGWRRWEVKFGPNANMDANLQYVSGGDCVASAASHDIFYGYLTFPDSRGKCNAQRDVWDGQWHRFRIHVKMGTGDGAMQVWWDDSLVIDRQGLNTQSGNNRFMGITFGGNRNQGTDVPMSFFYGPARLYRNNPGW